jgi:uncharacterized protein (DUF2249 family)
MNVLTFLLYFILIVCWIDGSLQAQNLGFSWLKQITGLSATNNYGKDIRQDLNGNYYVSGRMTTTCDFDPGPGSYTLSTQGVCPFVAKYDPLGNFIWAKQFNLTSTSNVNANISSFCLDNQGNVYCTGGFINKLDFDPGPSTYTLDATNGQNFICKLDNAGNFLWSYQFGKDSSSGPVVVELDNAGNPIIFGNFQKPNNDFDPGNAIYNISALGGNDVFILKLTTSGAFTWFKHLGNANCTVDITSATLDNSGNIVLSGHFTGSVDFDPGPNTYTMNSQNGYVYISRYSANGTFINAWQVASGGGYSDAIKTTNSGDIVVSIAFIAAGDFDPGINTLTFTPVGTNDIAMCKFNANGNLIWGRHISGSDFERAYALHVDALGNVVFGGQFRGTLDTDPGTGTYTIATQIGPNSDAFLTKLDVNGNFIWTKQFTGPWNKRISTIEMTANGDILATGFAQQGADFDPGKSSTCSHTMSALYYDPFILKLSPCSAPLAPVVNPSVVTSCGSASFALNASSTNSLTWRTQLMSNTYIDSVAAINTGMLAPGNYAYYAAAWNCCAESFPPAQVNVSVFPIPTISLIASKDTFCLGEPVVLTAQGGVSYVMGTTFSSGNFTVWPSQNTTYTVNGGDINNCVNTASIQLIYDPCTAITEQWLEQAVTVWPNPTADIVQLAITRNGVYMVEVYDNLGRLLFTKKIDIKDATPVTFNFNHQGVYQLVITSEESRVVKKVVVE